MTQTFPTIYAERAIRHVYVRVSKDNNSSGGDSSFDLITQMYFAGHLTLFTPDALQWLTLWNSNIPKLSKRMQMDRISTTSALNF